MALGRLAVTALSQHGTNGSIYRIGLQGLVSPTLDGFNLLMPERDRARLVRATGRHWIDEKKPAMEPAFSGDGRDAVASRCVVSGVGTAGSRCSPRWCHGHRRCASDTT
jgi:hypothetical protein